MIQVKVHTQGLAVITSTQRSSFCFDGNDLDGFSFLRNHSVSRTVVDWGRPRVSIIQLHCLATGKEASPFHRLCTPSENTECGKPGNHHTSTSHIKVLLGEINTVVTLYLKYFNLRSYIVSSALL